MPSHRSRYDTAQSMGAALLPQQRSNAGILSRAGWSGRFAAQLAAAFLAYYIAGKLGQATTNIRSSNLGPVWPAFGIALAAFLAYGPRIWPAITASAFAVAFSSPVPALAAAGQAVGASVAAFAGATLLRRIPHFDPSLSKLRDAIGLIVIGAFGSATISASIGVWSLFVTHVQAYSGLPSAWLIYWLGDSTGVLLVTPLVFSFPTLFEIRSRARVAEAAALLTLLAIACFMIFGDMPFFSVRLHVLAFAVLPLVMWAAINFGIAGASLSVFIIATIATLTTALGLGPFAAHSPFTNAVLLDVLFAILALTGLTMAAVITERSRAESERAQLVREQSALQARLQLATIVESSDDAIYSKDLEGNLLNWNRAAERIFGYTSSEVVGRPNSILFPTELVDEEEALFDRLKAGERVERHDTVRVTKGGVRIDISLTMSPLTDAAGTLIGASMIARDTSDHRRVQHALSSVNQKLIHAQEEERARIARELHDDIGQRLALLAGNIADSAVLSGSPGASNRAATLHRVVSEIASDVQSLSHQLHPAKLEFLGLTSAVRGFCDDLAQQKNVIVDFVTARPDTRLREDLSLCFFRVVQEALHNAVKHSRATRFEVELWESKGDLHLQVSDCGQGFDVTEAKTSHGLGLVSMEERLKLVHGNLFVDSAPGRGTRIHARAPLILS